jgi:hypothetical protein
MSMSTSTFDRNPNAPKPVRSVWLVGAGAALLAFGGMAMLRSHAFVQEVPIEVAPVPVEAVRPVDDGRIDHSVVRGLAVDPQDGPGRSVAAYDR